MSRPLKTVTKITLGLLNSTRPLQWFELPHPRSQQDPNSMQSTEWFLNSSRSKLLHRQLPSQKNHLFLHLDIAVADFASNPIIKLSIGTKIPPPPTPPTLPNDAPKNPIILPRTICHPNFRSCKENFTIIHVSISWPKSHNPNWGKKDNISILIMAQRIAQHKLLIFSFDFFLAKDSEFTQTQRKKIRDSSPIAITHNRTHQSIS